MGELKAKVENEGLKSFLGVKRRRKCDEKPEAPRIV